MENLQGVRPDSIRSGHRHHWSPGSPGASLRELLLTPGGGTGGPADRRTGALTDPTQAIGADPYFWLAVGPTSPAGYDPSGS
jgi:hypothetical protein